MVSRYVPNMSAAPGGFVLRMAFPPLASPAGGSPAAPAAACRRLLPCGSRPGPAAAPRSAAGPSQHRVAQRESLRLRLRHHPQHTIGQGHGLHTSIRRFQQRSSPNIEPVPTWQLPAAARWDLHESTAPALHQGKEISAQHIRFRDSLPCAIDCAVIACLNSGSSSRSRLTDLRYRTLLPSMHHQNTSPLHAVLPPVCDSHSNYSQEYK